jgi:hypothetical protein
MGEYEVKLQNQPVDISGAFGRQANQFFVGERTEGFDAGSGRILWKSLSLKQRVSYHQLTLQFEDYKVWEDTPPGEYEDDQIRPFSLSFVTPRTVRLRAAARPDSIRERESLMLVGESGSDGSWEVSDGEYSSTYAGWFGSVRVEHDPLHFEFRDASGRLLTRTNHPSDACGVVNSRPTPFSFGATLRTCTGTSRPASRSIWARGSSGAGSPSCAWTSAARRWSSTRTLAVPRARGRRLCAARGSSGREGELEGPRRPLRPPRMFRGRGALGISPRNTNG